VCDEAEKVELDATDGVGLANEDTVLLEGLQELVGGNVLGKIGIYLAVDLATGFGTDFLSLLYRPRRLPILTSWGSTFST